jgi:hypothetical protein
MVSWTRAAGIGTGYEIRTVLSADRIQAESPMTVASVAANIES